MPKIMDPIPYKPLEPREGGSQGNPIRPIKDH